MSNYIGSSRFDAVFRRVGNRKDKYAQFVIDLPGIHNDYRHFKKLVTRFGFRDFEILDLLEPTMMQCLKMTTDMRSLIKKNPEKTVLGFFCFCTHGMIRDGRQVTLVNEFSESAGFYKIFGAE